MLTSKSEWRTAGESVHATLFSGVSGVELCRRYFRVMRSFNWWMTGISGIPASLVKQRGFPFLSTKYHVARLQRIPSPFILQLTPS